jgi:hypothetical protein
MLKAEHLRLKKESHFDENVDEVIYFPFVESFFSNLQNLISCLPKEPSLKDHLQREIEMNTVRIKALNNFPLNKKFNLEAMLLHVTNEELEKRINEL